MTSVIGFAKRVWNMGHAPEPAKSSDAIRVGLFGASWIAPMAIIAPAKSHPDVIIAAIAARDLTKATAYAKKHNIPNVHGSYQELLDDPTIDAVYIPLPNSLHYEWTIRSLRAGKHVLLEKPSVSNATEAASLFKLHSSMPSPVPVLLEAFHYHFHPAWQFFLSLLDPASIASVHSTLSAPAYFFSKDDIRFQYSLSGGALMDMGTYCVHILRQVFGTEPEECVSVNPRLMPKEGDQNCEQAIRASWRFPNGGIGFIDVDLNKSKWALPVLEFSNVVVTHKDLPITTPDPKNLLSDSQTHHKTRTVTYWNMIAPAIWHRIDIVDAHVIRAADGKILKKWTIKESKKAYTWPEDLQEEGKVREGQEYWPTYRYMLEEFVNKVKYRPGSGIWIEGEDSVKQMAAIDGAYEKAELPLRPTSGFN